MKFYLTTFKIFYTINDHASPTTTNEGGSESEKSGKYKKG